MIKSDIVLNKKFFTIVWKLISSSNLAARCRDELVLPRDFEFVVNSWRFSIDLAQLAHYARVFFCRESEGPLFTLRVRVSIDELHIAHNECVLGIEGRLCGPVPVRVLPLQCDLLCALRSLDFFAI